MLCVVCITELQPAQKIGKLKSCVKELPKANYQTLKILSNHLRKYEACIVYTYYVL